MRAWTDIFSFVRSRTRSLRSIFLIPNIFLKWTTFYVSQGIGRKIPFDWSLNCKVFKDLSCPKSSLPYIERPRIGGKIVDIDFLRDTLVQRHKVFKVLSCPKSSLPRIERPRIGGSFLDIDFLRHVGPKTLDFQGFELSKTLTSKYWAP